MFAIFMKMVGRRGALLVVHDPRQHVVYLGEFLVDEENALAAIGQQPGQLIFVKNVCHTSASHLNRRFRGVPTRLQTATSLGCAIPRFAAIE
jgi:hypothetical protein